MPPAVFRLLDANLNRASEGLRVLEDVARFVVDDAVLSTELRTIRHSLAELARALDIRLVSARDSVADVGRESGLRVGGPRDLFTTVRANAKRVEESLRVIEELARLPETGARMDVGKAEGLRYSIYELEKRLAGRVTRAERVVVVRGLYVVVDRQAAGTRALAAIAAEAIDGGATVIQLRDKESERVDVYREAVELQALCASRNALFVVNDYADIAVLAGAGGLHIGQQDIPLGTIRHLLPLEMVVGVSCETEAEVCQAVEAGADYIAVGAVFPTTQKDVRVVTGTELIRRARSRVGAIPLVTIGGIGMHNVESVIEAGADAAAVIGAVVMQPDVRQAAEQMAQTIQRALERRERDG